MSPYLKTSGTLSPDDLFQNILVLNRILASMIFKRATFNSGNDGTDLGLWILGEAKRRERLREKNRCRNFILSYPRSGNHAVRFVVEFLSERPTLGADDQESLLRPAGLHDLPIFLRGSRINMEFPAPPPWP